MDPEAPLLSRRPLLNRTPSSSISNYMQLSHGYVFCINLIDLITSLVQIIAAIIVLQGTKGEHSEATWIIVYTCALSFHLPLLCRHLKHIYDNSESETRSFQPVTSCLSSMIEIFLAIWTVAFFFVLIYSSNSSLDHSSQLYCLSVIFLVIGCVRYVIPLVICSALCCCASMVLCFALSN